MLIETAPGVYQAPLRIELRTEPVLEADVQLAEGVTITYRETSAAMVRLLAESERVGVLAGGVVRIAD